jgi:hypothetical protein
MNCEYRKSCGVVWQANHDDEYLQKNRMHGAGEFALNWSIRHVASAAQ